MRNGMQRYWLLYSIVARNYLEVYPYEKWNAKVLVTP